MATHEPDFNQLLGHVHGFEAEKGKLLPSNVDKLSTYLIDDAFCGLHGPMDNWDDLLQLVYQRLAFFRLYYCGIDVPLAVAHGHVSDCEKITDRDEWTDKDKSFAEHFDERLVQDAVTRLKQESGTG